MLLTADQIPDDLREFFEPAACERCYVCRMVAVFREVWRVLRDDGTVWLNLGDSYASDPGKGGSGTFNGRNGRGEQYGRSSRPRGGLTGGTKTVDVSLGGGSGPGLKPKDLVGVPWRVAFALQADGWYLRSDIVWSKPNPMPESVVDRPTKAHEYLFLLAKRPRYFYDADAIREPHTYTERAHRDMGTRGTQGYAAAAIGSPQRDSNGGLGQHEAGRNRRSVWTIPTEPFPEAHFATYPQALVRPCILAGTSEHGECSSCGAPWIREVERGELVGKDRGGNYNGREVDPMVNRNHGTPGMAYENTTTGWRASCTCDAPTRPQTVLDPFIGSGTTALVARNHGRRCIGIDLSAEYLAIAARRLQQLSLLA